MKKMDCLHCGRPFDRENGHLCPKSPWMLEQEDINQILDDKAEELDIDEYEWIFIHSGDLPEISLICTEFFKNISNPSTDACFSKEGIYGADEHNFLSPVSFSKKSKIKGKSSIMTLNEGEDKISDDDDDGFDLENYAFITPADEPLPELSTDCPEVLDNISDSSSDSSLSQQEIFWAHQKLDGIQISFSEKSDTCDKPTINDIHAVPGPSRSPFGENKVNLSQRVFDSKQLHAVPINAKSADKKICQKAFTDGCIFKTHIEKHDGAKTHKCHFCDKSFLGKQVLKRHSIIHTGEKPFTCKICGRGFNRRFNLSRHMKSHKFPCENCGKSFTRMCLLKKHAQKHIDDKYYKCDICGELFLRQKTLRKHKKNKHK